VGEFDSEREDFKTQQGTSSNAIVSYCGYEKIEEKNAYRRR
jgi:hypothetical protein